MALDRYGGRRRFRLALLVLTAITFLTLDLRGFGPLDSAQQSVRDVLNPVRTTVGGWFHPITDRVGGIDDYPRLKKENAALRAQIEELTANSTRNEVDAQELRKLREQVGLGEELAFPQVIARVSLTLPGNFVHDTVEIDRGTASGIKPFQPVITKAGVVGWIERADRTRSTVKLITARDFNLTVRGGETLMLINGCGRADAVCSTKFADSNKKPQAGEKVFTYSGERFPGDLLVGTVTESDSEQEVRVELAVDLDNLDYVGVLLFDPKRNGS